MKKVFGQICYTVGEMFIVTFGMGLAFGLFANPNTNVTFTSAGKSKCEETSSKKETEE